MNTYFSRIPAAEQGQGDLGYRSICHRSVELAVEEDSEPTDESWSDCASVIGGIDRWSGVSQWAQDWFVYHNFVRGTALDTIGARSAEGAGIFVDIGAFHPVHLSNTLFFERCLGWRGLCVEPNPAMALHFEAQRPACKLVQNCVWSRQRTVVMSFEKDPIEAYIREDVASTAALGHGSRDVGNGAVPITGGGRRPEFTAVCRTLADILSSAGLRRPARIDYLSVDAEAAEVEVFRDFPFTDFDVSVISVEVQARNYYELDAILLENGFAKVAVLGGDHVYAQLQHSLTLPAGALSWRHTLSQDFHVHVKPRTSMLTSGS